MNVIVKRDTFDTAKADVLIVPISEALPLPATSSAAQLDAHLGGSISGYLNSGDFSAALNHTAMLRTQGRIPAPRVLLVGLGKSEAFTTDHLRQASASAGTTARKLEVKTMAMLLPTDEQTGALAPTDVAQAITEGVLLGLYTLKSYKSKTDAPKDALRELRLLGPGGNAQRALNLGVERGQILAEAVTLARDLANSPGNDVTPSYLAAIAKRIAKQTSLTCNVLDKSDMVKLKMGCLLGVAQGSDQPPALISLEHNPSGTSDAPIVLIGKGITFDSGGISIKPAANMEDMKMDMSGGAAVLGAMQSLAKLNYPRRVIGLVPASENLPSGKAVKPGDILRAMSGKTVEIINTDAEGRLVLADAISYAVEKLKPACIVDLATLTGAVVVALGSHVTGMMGTDDAMMDRLRTAGDRSAERVWQLPLYAEYSEQIVSDFADIKNTGGREAGSITGGAFIKEFVGDTPWVHLDIAGTAWTHSSKPYIPKGATGVGVRLLVETLEQMPKPTSTSKSKPKSKSKTMAKAKS